MSRLIYGTTRLGDNSIPFEQRVSIAREAINAGLWIHTSHSYGDALQVLNVAFDEDRKRIPQAIFKIGWDSVEQVRAVISQNLGPVNLQTIDIGQLCLGGGLAEQFRTGGPVYDGLNELKKEGLVGRFVLEMWPWSSDVAVDALRTKNAGKLVDGLIFYLNPLQRFVTNELWDLVQDQNFPVIAMRSTCGGSLEKLLHEGGVPEYLRHRAAQMQPIYHQSSCKSWTEFCIRYSLGFPQVRATVGATSRSKNLQQLIRTVASATPLAEDIQKHVMRLQRLWSDEHDKHAAPWSM
jgi:predicted aldo/keto reductase-like oxidoreductase